MSNQRNVRQFLVIRDDLLEALSAQQDMRKRYDGTKWIAAERDVMLDAVNAWRGQLGLRPVDLAAIERVERMAVGHSDYSSKFALYCAEIAMGVKEQQP